jgi:hypothetical protein
VAILVSNKDEYSKDRWIQKQMELPFPCKSMDALLRVARRPQDGQE